MPDAPAPFAPSLVEEARAALGSDLTIDIVTTGARSGRPRTTEIWFTRVDGTIYICGTPGGGDRDRVRAPRDWLANLRADPEFTFVLKESASIALPARAVVVDDPGERRRLFTDPATAWYRETTGSVDALVEDGPAVRVAFTGLAAVLNPD